MLGSPCVAEASVHRICRPCKPMPALPCCMQDLGFFCCVCRFTFSETLFFIDLWLKCFALVHLSRTSTRMEQSTGVFRAHANTGSSGSRGNAQHGDGNAHAETRGDA